VRITRSSHGCRSLAGIHVQTMSSCPVFHISHIAAELRIYIPGLKSYGHKRHFKQTQAHGCQCQPHVLDAGFPSGKGSRVMGWSEVFLPPEDAVLSHPWGCCDLTQGGSTLQSSFPAMRSEGAGHPGLVSAWHSSSKHAIPGSLLSPGTEERGWRIPATGKPNIEAWCSVPRG
jgi:hypothetical protein